MTYKVEKPKNNLHWSTLIIKYIVLFICLFFASWIVLPFVFSHKSARTANQAFEMFLSDPKTTSLLISLSVCIWLIYQAFKKYTFGEVFEMEFDSKHNQITIKSTNTLNNKEKEIKYDYENISFQINTQEDPLFGKQRIVKIFNKGEKINQINIERTAWVRHDKLEELLEIIKNWA